MLEESVAGDFFRREHIRAAVGTALCLIAYAAGRLVAPSVALVIVSILRIFFATTSEGAL